MQNFIQEFRVAVRVLSRNPVFAIISILTLAVGISANTTIFSWINSTLLNPIPGVRKTDRFVSLAMGDRNGNSTPPLSFLDYVDLRERARSFRGLMAYHDDWMHLTGVSKPERVYGAFVSANYFDVLGIRPTLGRVFLATEEQKPGSGPVAVISHSLWQSRFEGKTSIIGETIEINRQVLTIVGVASPEFQGCKSGLRTDVWIPVSMTRSISVQDQTKERDNCWLNGFGCLIEGVSRAQAEAEVNLVMSQIAQQFPDSHKNSIRIKLEPLWRSSIGANGTLSLFLPILIGVSGVILLLACANVSNLFLVRLIARRREIAIRISVGASRRQLITQFLIESLLLSFIAGAIGFLMTHWTANAFSLFVPEISVPVVFSIKIDSWVLLSSIALAVFAGIAFGLLPALRSSRARPLEVIKEDTSGSVGHKSRLMRGLVVTQIALSTMLLVCAGLFFRSLRQAEATDPGFDTSDVLLCSFDLQPLGYARTNGLAFFRTALPRIQALPGVESATLADSVPLCFENHTSTVNPEGYVRKTAESMEIGRAYVGPNYLRTLKIRIEAGRDLTVNDDAGAPSTALINKAFAERYWPGQNALGKRVEVEGRWATVVGITEDFRWRNIAESRQPFIFLPLLQDYYPLVTLHVRVTKNPMAFASLVTGAIRELDPELSVFDITTLSSRTRASAFMFRVLSTMAGIFGLVALGLAAIGIYGVVSYTTRLRTREVGIRMALGAQRQNVFVLILRNGLSLAMAGILCGLGLSVAATQLLRNLFYQVSAMDAQTYAAVSLLLGLIALLACAIPAMNAMRLAPADALRHD